MGAQVAIIAGGAALYLAPHVFKINDHPPSCARCDPQTVPWFDRWAIAPPRNGVSAASSVLLAGLAAATWWDIGRRDRSPLSNLAPSVAAASWAVGTSELLKAIVARKRPVLYTLDVARVSNALDNQRSLPSGHATAAFALATAYWLESGSGTWKRWATMAAAVGVSSLRVAAAKHFPSDVVVGAAIGVGSAVVVYKLRM